MRGAAPRSTARLPRRGPANGKHRDRRVDQPVDVVVDSRRRCARSPAAHRRRRVRDRSRVPPLVTACPRPSASMTSATRPLVRDFKHRDGTFDGNRRSHSAKWPSSAALPNRADSVRRSRTLAVALGSSHGQATAFRLVIGGIVAMAAAIFILAAANSAARTPSRATGSAAGARLDAR